MLLKNSHLWVDASLRTRYGLAALMLLAAYLLRVYADSWLSPHLPTQFFLLSALLTALWFGYTPALISLVVGWLIGLYYFVEPYGQFTPANIYDIVVTANDLLSGVIGIAVIEYLQRTRYSKRLMLAVSESRYRSLLRLDNHRVHQQRLSMRALRQINDVLAHLDRVLLLVDEEKRVFVQPLLQSLLPLEKIDAAADWITWIVADDRKAVELSIDSVTQGLRDSCDVAFRLSGVESDQQPLQCAFRKLSVGSDRSIYALLRKPPQSLQP